MNVTERDRVLKAIFGDQAEVSMTEFYSGSGRGWNILIGFGLDEKEFNLVKDGKEVIDHFKELVLKTPLYQSALGEFAELNSQQEAKILELEAVIAELTKYKHYAEVAKEIGDGRDGS